MEDIDDKKYWEELRVDDRAVSVLPKLDYTALVGASVYYFDRCQSFIVELLVHQPTIGLEWRNLTDKTAGQLCPIVEKHLDDKSYIDPKLHDVFSDLSEQRDRIVHGYPVTDTETGEQRLHTKNKEKTKNEQDWEKPDAGKQYPITHEYMLDFIKQVADLTYRLDDVRALMKDHKDYK